jgi:hypothetical protein
MNAGETFWWLLTMAAVGWYVTVTLYVGVRGALDIRQMLRRLEAEHGRRDD